MKGSVEQVQPAQDGRLPFPERLRIERERLGITQEEFGKLGGVAKSSQWLYEQGRHWPTVEFLEALRLRQVDVGYLATGIRQDPETLRHALSFVLRLARQEGRNFSDEQLFSVFQEVVEAASRVTPDATSPADQQVDSVQREPGEP